MSLKRKPVPELAQAGAPKKKAKAEFFVPRTSTSTAVALFKFDSKIPSATRLVAWNVNGIKSLDEKILKKYLEAEDPDIIIFTETKFSKGKPDILCLKTRFKYQSWGTDPRPGQAGTAVLSKQKPLNTVIGLPTWPNSSVETAGRYVELEFENVYIVGTYVPNAGENFKSMDVKQKWNAAFMAHLRELDSKKAVIWAGDFNCVPSKKDIDHTAQSYWNRMSGLSEVERTEFDSILKDDPHHKFVDVWRHLHPEAEEFTHSSPKFGAWRLDSFIMSERILDKAALCDIRHDLKDMNLSDHWPVALDFASTL